uniref:Putative ribonuclease H-like domain-containing protein n=1 Tax=Tanacetum cinerariifolium TaxID=118510 RepID=A0A6L2NI96_TANCI|nr:putative ribonuclease H-like domain-containing protein [Tanacetum cinerariifolium]
MEAIEKRYGGNKESKKVQRTLLKQQYKNFTASSSETLDQTFDRLQKLISQLEIQAQASQMKQITLLLDLVLLILKSYQTEEEHPINYALMALTSSGSSSSLDFEVDSCSRTCIKAYATLKEQYDSLSSDYKKSQLNLVSYKSSLQSVEERLAHYKKNEVVFEEKIIILNLEVKLRDNALVENTKKLEKAEKERDELKLTLEKFQNSSKSLNNLLVSQVSDKVKTRLGYKAVSPVVESFVNSSEILENQENVKSRSDKGYHEVPPPYTRNYIPPKPDLTFIDEQVKSDSVDVVSNVASSDVKTVESKHESIDVKNKGVYSTIETKHGNPQQKEYKEKGVIDSGCSRHMTRNKCYLTDYEDYDGGFVSFGDGKGRISGKGKIKSGTLDFDDVYFCKELKYNLFSMSQMCNKKNNVLFTDTKCLVLSSNFKLLDKTQVLLRVPRKDNIYSVDLKSVVPTGGLTCLVAKAIIDESNLWHRRHGHINYKTMNKLVMENLVRCLPLKFFENTHGCVACQKRKQQKASYKAKLVNSISKPLHMLHIDLFGPTNVKSLMKKSYCLVVTDDFSRFSWVFFLATKDETSGILKTFITEIENKVDCKVKIIRSDNGTEFKNYVMKQFCNMKGIKREFSVARTPQQNGVAERKNRTLIEATRTMLVDSKLPTIFWAEAVNTACYVLNRALIIKPHNKTPYELIYRRPPLIDFMKPFRCPVTILNTRDHLGKFDGKANERFFIGYSVVSKAMRVFNKRTRIVEEILNIRFLENAPNLKGNRPDWLFDINSYTISMNYEPFIAGKQSNGPKDSAVDARKKATEVDES